MLILLILLFYISFMFFKVVLTLQILWINFVAVYVWLFQTQGYMSLLNLMEERDQERPDPLWMEMFWAIKAADEKIWG